MSMPSKAALQEAQKWIEQRKWVVSDSTKNFACGIDHAAELISIWIRANTFILYDEWRAAGCSNSWADYLANAITSGKWLPKEN